MEWEQSLATAYEQTLQRIHALNRFGSRLGLERIEKLMELLGNPQDSMKVIHIAGTNGKGSVSRYLYTVLREGGYHVGLYTSPFLERFTERIEYDGEEISPAGLVNAAESVFAKVDEMINCGLDSPTEFEVVTAIAFCYFQKMGAEFIVLEVGLGGRGDSTNVLKHPVACVVTSISYDHMEYLGNTLEKIAAEKAGIFKPQVPVIANVKDAAAAAVIRSKAEELGCPYYGWPLGEIKNRERSLFGYTFDTEGYQQLRISMIGDHQVENALCALAVIEVLNRGNIINIDKKAVYEGMFKAVQPGRFEVLGQHPYLVIDGAHNEAGAAALAKTVAELFPQAKILMMVGILADKKSDQLLDSFCAIAEDYVATEPDNVRKLAAQILWEEIQKRGKNCTAIAEPEEACRYLIKKKGEYDLIIVAGSLYLIGAVRGILKNA